MKAESRFARSRDARQKMIPMWIGACDWCPVSRRREMGFFINVSNEKDRRTMTEDLLDYWVRLIKPLFPTNAWIVTRYSGDDHIIEIDWKLDDDPGQPNRRSRKIQITISDGAIEDYLGRNKKEREEFEIGL